MKRTGRPPIDEEDASVPVCVSLPGRQYDALYTRAQAAGVSVPEVIRRDLEQVGAAEKPVKQNRRRDLV